MDSKPRSVTMEQVESELPEIAIPCTIMCDEGPDDDADTAEMVSVQQLSAEARALYALLPKATIGDSLRIVVSAGERRDTVEVWINCKAFGGAMEIIPGATFAEAIAAARSFISAAPDRRRAEAERRLAEAQATLAALDAEA